MNSMHRDGLPGSTCPCSPAERFPGRGAFVVVVGPDGVGKTSVARALLRGYEGPTGYFHFLPPFFGRLAPGPPDVDRPQVSKGAPQGSRLLGWLRLARTMLRCWLGYCVCLRPALSRGALVVGDRWAYGYVVQPRALRYYGPRSLAKLALKVLPGPDLVVNLSASPDVIRQRKQELTLGEITKELKAWASLPEPRLWTIEASQSPEAIARRILEVLRG